ncbi:MAG: amidohydrolase [Leptolyngbyaceae bacterium]|nr:amidohydrolase [Leptolyngbyaceae bacterium]
MTTSMVTIEHALVCRNNHYETQSIQVIDGWITDVAQPPSSCPTPMNEGIHHAESRIDATDQLLLPGFVNAHTHSSELWCRGYIPPLPLELWLAELYDIEVREPEQIYLSALGTAVETLLSGGTTVVDHLVPIPGKEIESVAAAAKAYQEIGIRAFIGPLLQDEPMEAAIPTGKGRSSTVVDPAHTRNTLSILEEAIQSFHQPEQGVFIMAAPTGMQLCSDAFFEGCVELSDRHSLCRHTHLLESKAQKMLAHEKYGCTAVQHLDKLGFLGDRTSLAHSIWLEESDIQTLARTQSTVVHNPLSNLRLGSGIAPLLRYRQAGVNVTFGCDGAASNDSQDVLEAIKIGTLLHNTTDFDYRNWITPQEAVRMASLGGAKGLGMGDRLGTIEVGKLADLVLYNLKSLSLLPRTDPIGLLVMGRPVQTVEHVWVNGRQVVKHGQVTTIDVEALKKELYNRSQWSKASGRSPSRAKIEAHYRSVMGLPE